MDEGLQLRLDEFKKMKVRQQMCILFENQQRTLKIIEGYKFYQKLSAMVGSFLVICIGLLAKIQILK